MSDILEKREAGLDPEEKTSGPAPETDAVAAETAEMNSAATDSAAADTAIEISHLTKVYRLYNKPSDRLKEALGLTRKKRYRELYALNDVSFRIGRGETVGIIGTNGSGKSTILKIITGVLNETSGSVTVNGRISALLELGAGFNMEYTGVENVYLNGTMMGFSEKEIDARLQDILDFADIGDFVNQPVKTYSSGMFVRLAFAVAINIDPEILIVDEALSVGDVFFQAKCYHKFEEFRKMGKTILFVSHDLSSIVKYCDRVVLLNKGIMLDEGSPKEMVDLYKKLLVNHGGDEAVARIMEERTRLHEENAVDGDGEDGGENADGAHGGSDGASGETAGDAAGGKSASPKADDPFEQGEGITGLLPMNPNTIDYGEHQAEILRVATFDAAGNLTNTIEKDTDFEIRMKVRFYEHVESPIFAYTFKNLQGTEITGTNSFFEEAPVTAKDAGDEVTVSFRQKMTMQGGEYLLSFGCTGYHEGDFRVFHRLYDVLGVTVISTKNTVGFYDMQSKVKVETKHVGDE